MSDDIDIRGPRDRGRISLEQPHEVRYWTRELGVTEAQLRAAMYAAGDATHAVQQQLQGASGARRPVQMQ
ncbi:MAG: DUF3606 domain-containing protein [Variovorax sp.]